MHKVLFLWMTVPHFMERTQKEKEDLSAMKIDSSQISKG